MSEDGGSLVRKLEVLGVFSVLAGARAGDILACDEIMLEQLGKSELNRNSNLEILHWKDVPSRSNEHGRSRVIVCSASREHEIAESLFKRLGNQVELIGFKTHGLAFGWNHALNGSPVAPPRSIFGSDLVLYAVVCSPRSGSTFLCEAMESAGFGNPREHVQMPMIECLRAGSADFSVFDVLEELLQFETFNGVFGTKLIAHFLFDAQQLIGLFDRRHFARLASHVKIIYIYRRNRLRQAVSLYRAQNTSVWHSTQSTVEARARAKATLTYDYDKIEQLLNFLEFQEGFLAYAFADHPAVLTICYEDMVSNVGATIASIGSLLGRTPKGSPQTRSERISDERTDEIVARFCHDYKSKWDKEMNVEIIPPLALARPAKTS